MYKSKLQIRIFLFIIGLSSLFITVFVSIQLQNHLNRLHSYNQYRARIATITVKTTLEILLKEEQSDKRLTEIFKAGINSFTEERIVEKMAVMSLDGKIIATNDPVIKGLSETKRDIKTYFRLSEKSDEDRWFYSTINEKTKNIDVYIPVSIRPKLIYLVKLSFSTDNIQEAVIHILVPISLTIVIVIIGSIFLGITLLKIVVRPIKTLTIAINDVALGNLEQKINIKTGDEIEELGNAFNNMVIALRKRKREQSYKKQEG